MENQLIEQIKSRSVLCGIASEDVNLVKSLVDNKCKDKTLFVTEGLWAVEKLIQKNFEVTHFYYNQDNF